ncbi:MAG: M61 family metallopeptidase, partial [Nitrososphaerales archaeon]
CEKESKNKWAVTLDGAMTVKISYRVYAFEYTVDTSYLDTRHGVINGASVFPYVEGAEKETLLLTIIPNREWRVITTALERVENKAEGTSFNAPSYDVLIDSPIEIGNQQVYSFEVSNVPHEVSIFGPTVTETSAFVSDLKRIVEVTWPIFGEIPYKRYVFLVDFVGGSSGGGLEHLNSTHCIAPRLRMKPVQDYRSLMSLFSHEFFHAWNIKRLRPVGLGPFDYTNETYTKSLWVAEGITSYYDDLILRRAGLFSVPEYLDAFSININSLQSFPSSRFESAEEASFDAWVKHYRPNENTANTQSSYYIQGAVIGWMIDMETRHATSSKKSLDDVMRKIYRETFSRDGRGYTEEEFEATSNEVAGKSLSSEIFDTRVRGRAKVDFQKFLDYAGLKLGPKSKNPDSKGYLGVKLRTDGGRAVVVSKLFDTPAEASGLASGDEIVALDNLRMDMALISHYISHKNPGDIVRILISRDGYLETIEAKLGAAPLFEYRIYKSDTATQEQQNFFKAWMLAEWSLPLDYIEYAPSPLKPKQFDYV